MCQKVSVIVEKSVRKCQKSSEECQEAGKVFIKCQKKRQKTSKIFKNGQNLSEKSQNSSEMVRNCQNSSDTVRNCLKRVKSCPKLAKESQKRVRKESKNVFCLFSKCLQVVRQVDDFEKTNRTHGPRIRCF